jgi:Fic family protein
MFTFVELAPELSKISLLEDINALQKAIDTVRPLDATIKGRIEQKFRLDWNYHSNAIEGNALTYGETKFFLMEGITAIHKPLKDHLDIKGHDQAIDYLLSVVKEKNYQLTEVEIRNLHKLLLQQSYFSDALTPEGQPTKKEVRVGEYKQMPNHVLTPTGKTHYYASPEETPIKMHELVAWYNNIHQQKNAHPLVIAALFHHQFVAIHPFDDGNGRMGRLLMNLILLQHRFPPVVVKQEDRLKYYAVLQMADDEEYVPLIEYLAEELLHALQIYWKGAKGEAIEDEKDLEKEIQLRKQSIQASIAAKKTEKEQAANTYKKILQHSIVPLFKQLKSKIFLLEPLFSEKSIFSIEVTKNYSTNKLVSYSSIEGFEAAIDTMSDFISAKEIVFSTKLEQLKEAHTYIEQTIRVIVKISIANGYKVSTNFHPDVKLEKQFEEPVEKIESDAFVNSVIRSAMAEIEQKAL